MGAWTIISWITLLAASLAGLAALSWLFHRVCTKLEDAGYMHYRKSSGGGGGSVLHELDRLVQPSIEHVIEAQDAAGEEQEIDGD